ncbi:MAG: hypothetical protein P4M11_03120 [Candidatus Pacebacteria bacterium]|nr:hypothetical protein [Candidatus Paceibacterota bacterium]
MAETIAVLNERIQALEEKTRSPKSRKHADRGNRAAVPKSTAELQEDLIDSPGKRKRPCPAAESSAPAAPGSQSRPPSQLVESSDTLTTLIKIMEQDSKKRAENLEEIKKEAGSRRKEEDRDGTVETVIRPQ